MTNNGLAHEDVVDLQVTLYETRSLIAGLCSRQSFPLNNKMLSRLDAMRTCVGLMKDATGSGKGLTDEFLDVLNPTRGRRDVADMSVKDFGIVAGQYQKWLPTPLTGAWRSLFYDIHSAGVGPHARRSSTTTGAHHER